MHIWTSAWLSYSQWPEQHPLHCTIPRRKKKQRERPDVAMLANAFCQLPLYNTLQNSNINKLALYVTDGRLFTTDVSVNFKVMWHKNWDKYHKSSPNKFRYCAVKYHTVKYHTIYMTFDGAAQFKNLWSVADSHCKWQRRQLLKMVGFSNSLQVSDYDETAVKTQWNAVPVTEKKSNWSFQGTAQPND